MRKDTMTEICKSYPISNSEFNELDKEYGKLVEYAAWQLIEKNTGNNHTLEQPDIAQELKISLIRAGSYYKRQVYIEECFDLVQKYAKTESVKQKVAHLFDLWKNKTRHGSNKQKFGSVQEKQLEQLVMKIVPKHLIPSKQKPLKIDSKFSTYCKAIAWNTNKFIGKKITREKSFRVGQVSLSEFDYQASNL